MTGILSRQRNLPTVSRPWLWLLLVLAVLAYPVDVPARETLARSKASLTAPAAPSDLIATPAEKTQARNILPAQLPAGPPAGSELPLPDEISGPLHRPPDVLLPPVAPPAAPSLPRPPPQSC